MEFPLQRHHVHSCYLTVAVTRGKPQLWVWSIIVIIRWVDFTMGPLPSTLGIVAIPLITAFCFRRLVILIHLVPVKALQVMILSSKL